MATLVAPRARGRPRTNAFRPTCPAHPKSTVRLDGFTTGWSSFHRRPRYRCVTQPGTRGHRLNLPIPVRTPPEHHPDSGQACPRCEHVLERHEGTKTGADFIYGHTEIASVLVRVGAGDSLRLASRTARQVIFRTNQAALTHRPRRDEQGRSSRGRVRRCLRRRCPGRPCAEEVAPLRCDRLVAPANAWLQSRREGRRP